MQGSNAIANREHEVRLETTLRRQRRGGGGDGGGDSAAAAEWSDWSELDWQVVDIDGWLGGNPLLADAAEAPTSEK
jgi:hypothetical protein